ncbi:hypothetical protein H0H93_005740 [Arthromyces matolae]|nr:hypothetical protein H0H93_005740 [Arthromyces matolae]
MVFHWESEISIPDLLTLEPSPPPTTLSFVRTGLSGRVTGYVETPNPRVLTGRTSSSLDRAPAPSKTFVRGKSGYVPFWPGGLEDPLVNTPDEGFGQQSVKGLRTIAPGLSRGLRLPGDEIDDEELLALDNVTGPQSPDREIAEETETVEQDGFPTLGTSEIDDLLPTTTIHLKPSKPQRRVKSANIVKRDWAHVIDVNTPLSNFHQLVPDMAHKYPFELDTFQKQAVYHLEMGDSVFVAAHTSAGKTVVAEYAIALAEKHMTRAIYTSPIKALSNQKFRDFKQTFSSSSVGILTGDVQINPEAACLVMTTEILRSMLYKGADLIRDVEFVIFDEVHYVNDAERGVVWEEVIIMLPDHVNIILLSATVPNTKEFADWVGRTKKKDIYVISTAQRPVPLEHYLYAGRELYKIVDAKRNFLGQGYKDAGEALRRKQDKEREAAGLPPVQRVGARGAAPAQRGAQRGGRGAAPVARGRGGGGRGGPPRSNFSSGDKHLYVHLIGHLRKKALLPVVVFTFSKKRCEENAGTLTNLDLCTAVEKSEVHVAVEKALSRLKGSDKKLPQIGRMRELLSRGIGVHHGGLLPLVKEVVEILFARGLVKVLFATETFAMGVNMPAKCVVFSGIRKHDGRNFRDILPGEYTQMAGRAGRRGLDPTGTVIIVANDSLPEQTTLHTMMLGTPGKLSSQFRLTYNMILNLLRVEALKVEEMIKRSFSENASQRLLPDQQKKVVEHRSSEPEALKYGRFSPTGGKVIVSGTRGGPTRWCKANGPANYVLALTQLQHFRDYTAAILLKPAPLQTLEDGLFGKVPMYYALALVDPQTKHGDRDIDGEAIPPHWPPDPAALVVSNGTYELRAIPLTSVSLVTSRSVKVFVDSIVERHLISRMNEAIGALQALVDEWQPIGEIPENDWGRMRSLDFQELLQTRNSIIKKIRKRSCILCSDFTTHYQTIHAEKVLRANIANLKLALSDQNLELIPDYEQRVAVLQELKFVDENSTVLLKGRVACEINSANELILTELILENTLASYEPEEVVALLSCFVFQEKTEVEPTIPPKLEAGRDAILAISDRVGRVQDYHKVSVEDFRSNLKFGLVEVVYEWAKGMPFEQITSLTDVAEGTIVRVITRLDETCREVRDAARVIGDAGLFKKMEEAQIKIKRDIASSTYLIQFLPLMSQPDTPSDTPGSPIDFFEHTSFIERSSRKRSHNFIDDGMDDDSQKTRRVNPQRLAARLGPEIVADMEALIYPGAKMPSFEVRRVIQEKYSVDRRHIYDYFHSRELHVLPGLRVAKEDRHTNLTRGRLSKLAKQTQSKTPTVGPGVVDPPVEKASPSLEKKRSIDESTCTEASVSKSRNANPLRGSISTMQIPIHNDFEQLSSRSAKLAATERIVNQKKRRVRNPTSHISKATKEFKKNRMSTPQLPITESSPARLLSPVPVLVPSVESPSKLLNDDRDGLFLSSPHSFPNIFLEIQDAVDNLDHGSSFNTPHFSTPAILEEHRVLTRIERNELYNFINDNIDASSGLTEQVGTYCRYMKDCTQLYFNRIVSNPNHPTMICHGYDNTLCLNSKDMIHEEIDLGNWLSGYDEQEPNRTYIDQPFHSSEDTAAGNLAMASYVLPIVSVDNDALSVKSVNSGEPGCLHYDYSPQLSDKPDHSGLQTSTSPSTSRLAQHRHNPRSRLPSHVQRTLGSETFHNADSALRSNTLGDTSSCYSGYQYNPLYLHISRSRLRTSSAGGGL